MLATLFFPFIALIAALILQGGQPDPVKKSQLRTWAWASGGLMLLDLSVRRARRVLTATLLHMAANAETARSSALERSWWLRVPAVLVAPRAVFVSLRDDSEEAVEARQEPITALAALAGIAGVLATPVARTLLNDGSVTVSVIPVWAFFGGMVYAIAVYWLGGGLLFGAARRFGSLGSYRRARHVLALSGAPVALTLFTVWPIRIAIYGENLFRTGGP